MRDKLIEMCLDFVEPTRSAEELNKYTNEHLLKLIEKVLIAKDFSKIDITAIDNTYSEDVGGALADDVLFGGNHPSDWDGGDADKYAMPAFDSSWFTPAKRW
tara:strand:+ start:696 stop:1001 length:306 start_codon:yes stop_codon:yes gene_type:complete